MAATESGKLCAAVAAPQLEGYFGEAVVVTRADSSTLSFTATGIRRGEQLGAKDWDDAQGRMPEATLFCGQTDWPTPAETDSVAIETYPGSGTTVAMKVKGRPMTLSDQQMAVSLVRIEFREGTAGPKYRTVRK